MLNAVHSDHVVVHWQGSNWPQRGQHHNHSARLACQGAEPLPLRGVEAKRGTQVGLLCGDSSEVWWRERAHRAGEINDVCLTVSFSRYQGEESPKQWSDVRYEHVMKLRQVALESAREMWADYFMVGQQDYSLQAQKKKKRNNTETFSISSIEPVLLPRPSLLFSNGSRGINTETSPKHRRSVI